MIKKENNSKVTLRVSQYLFIFYFSNKNDLLLLYSEKRKWIESNSIS